jgi:HEAT repeat protein
MVLSIFLATPRQPRYQGRTLSEWLVDLSSGNYQTQRLARVAIQEMGPAAVPFLTNSLAQRNAISIRMYRKNFLPRKITAWSHRIIKWQTPMMESRNAAIALQSLGPEASNAIPALVAAAGDPSWTVAQAAAGALAAMGSNAVPALDQRLSKASPAELPWLLQSAMALGTNAAPLAPKLAPLLETPLWGSAAAALAGCGAAAVPIVTDRLATTNQELQIRALHVFGNMGTKAVAATNAIVPLTMSTNANVRYAAFTALSAMMLPKDAWSAFWASGLHDSDARNVEICLRQLAIYPGNVRAYNREIALLASHPTNSIRQVATNALTMWRAWPD